MSNSSDAVLALVNHDNNLTITDDQISFGNPSVVTGARDTSVTISGVTGKGYTGQVTVTYNRVGLTDVITGSPTLTPPGAHTVDLIPALNTQFGLNLEADDLQNDTLPKSHTTAPVAYNLTASTTSLAWEGDVGISLNSTVPNMWDGIFSGSDVGMAFNVNRLDTLFQDTGGTVPVTAAGQTVKAIKCMLTGTLCTNTTGMVLGFDSTRNTFFITGVKGQFYQGATVAGFTGNNNRSVAHIANLNGVVEVAVPLVLQDQHITNQLGQYFGLGNIDKSNTFSYIFYQGGDPYNVGFVQGVVDSGYAARIGTKNVNQLTAYKSSGGDLGTIVTQQLQGNTTAAVISTSFVQLANMNGPFYGAFIINRVLTATEMQAIATYAGI